MPGVDRNIVKSLMAHARGLLQSPPAASGLSPFTVYNEKDLAAVDKSGKLPAWPFIFLLDDYMDPKPALLPMIIIDVEMTRQLPFEVGNRKGRTVDAVLHCFGKTRGMRDDLSSFFVDYLGNTFPVNRYTSSPSGDTYVFVENAEIEPDVISQPVTRQLSADMIREGTLKLWQTVSFRFKTKN